MRLWGNGMGRGSGVGIVENTFMMVIESVNKLLESLKSIDLQNYPQQMVVEILDDLIKYPIIPLTEFHLGKVIWRARPLKVEEESNEITSRQQLSYKPKEFNTTYQRASTPSKTMFYGSILPQENTHSEINSEILVAALESSFLLREPQKFQNGEQKILFGKWRILSTCKLHTIMFADNSRNVSPYAKSANQNFNELTEGYPEYKEQTKILVDYFAEEFSKFPKNIVLDGVLVEADYDYMISANLTELLSRKHTDGVIYPSVRGEGKGINMAISPDFVDNHMRLEIVVECKIYKKGKNVFMNNLRMAHVDAETQTFKLEEIEIGNSRAPDFAISQMLS